MSRVFDAVLLFVSTWSKHIILVPLKEKYKLCLISKRTNQTLYGQSVDLPFLGKSTNLRLVTDIKYILVDSIKFLLKSTYTPKKKSRQHLILTLDTNNFIFELLYKVNSLVELYQIMLCFSFQGKHFDRSLINIYD